MKPMGSIRNNWAIKHLANRIAKHINRGVATANTVRIILNNLKSNYKIRHLKTLDNEFIQDFARNIAESVENGELTGKTGATYCSAINAISDYVNHFFNKKIQKIRYSELNIHKQEKYNDKSVNQNLHEQFKEYLNKINNKKTEALKIAIELQREIGLRFREAAGLNKITIENALRTGKLELSRRDWTKNARPRKLLLNEAQKELLQRVLSQIEKQGGVNLAGARDIKSFREIAIFRNAADKIRQKFNTENKTNYRYHGERHAYAHNRFTQLWQDRTNHAIIPPIVYYSQKLTEAGWSGEGKFYRAVKEFKIEPWSKYAIKVTDLSQREIRELDKTIREIISKELGHNRLDITNTYLGHP